jgi:Protein of unknown function (DUF3224)
MTAMTKPLLATLALGLATAALSAAQPTPEPRPTHAAGAFDVKMTPAGETRFTLDKSYRGDLTATATGEMLVAMTATEGSAGYVAIEKVTGTLAGRTGTFHLQHTGTMNRGKPTLSITVVPDSGTAGLTGLTGSMAIQIGADGSHAYTFDYTLPEQG